MSEFVPAIVAALLVGLCAGSFGYGRPRSRPSRALRAHEPAPKLLVHPLP